MPFKCNLQRYNLGTPGTNHFDINLEAPPFNLKPDEVGGGLYKLNPVDSQSSKAPGFSTLKSLSSENPVSKFAFSNGSTRTYRYAEILVENKVVHRASDHAKHLAVFKQGSLLVREEGGGGYHRNT